MALKLLRSFFGGYTPNYAKLQAMNYSIVRLPRPIITVLNADQGLGQIKGTARKLNIIYPNAKICVFKRENRQFLWETKADKDGKYLLRNIAKGLECFVVAFDPNEEYNALVQDKVVAK